MYPFPRAAERKYHKLGGLKTTEIYYLIVLETRSLKSNISRSVLPLTPVGDNVP